jgi:hypothetical protein
LDEILDGFGVGVIDSRMEYTELADKGRVCCVDTDWLIALKGRGDTVKV